MCSSTAKSDVSLRHAGTKRKNEEQAGSELSDSCLSGNLKAEPAHAGANEPDQAVSSAKKAGGHKARKLTLPPPLILANGPADDGVTKPSVPGTPGGAHRENGAVPPDDLIKVEASHGASEEQGSDPKPADAEEAGGAGQRGTAEAVEDVAGARSLDVDPALAQPERMEGVEEAAGKLCDSSTQDSSTVWRAGVAVGVPVEGSEETGLMSEGVSVKEQAQAVQCGTIEGPGVPSPAEFWQELESLPKGDGEAAVPQEVGQNPRPPSG